MVDAKMTPDNPEIMPTSLRKLFRYADGYDKIAIAVGSVTAFAGGAAFPLMTVVLGEAFDTMGDADPDVSYVDTMKTTVLAMAYLSVMVTIISSIQATCFAWSSERQGARLRRAYLRAALARDQTWYDTHDAAAIPTRMQVECAKMQEAIGMKFGLLLQPCGQFVSGIGIGFYYGWKLTLVIVCFLPVIAAGGVLLAKSAELEAKQTWYAKAGAVAEEALFSMRTVAAFGGEARELARYKALLGEAAKGGVSAGNIAALGWAVLLGGFGASYACAFWFSGAFLFTKDGDGDFSGGGDVILVFFSAIIGVSGLSDGAMPASAISAGLTAGAHAFTIIDETSAIESLVDETASNEPAEKIESLAELRLEEVEFAYPSKPDVPVLQGVSLAIKGGQKVAFVGESGSGKSTIVQLLERFYDPASGSVTVNGKALSTLSLAAWRRAVGYVGQEPVLFAASALENIRLAAPSASDDECRAAARQAEALEFLEALPQGMSTYVGQGGGQMSGGQKQRLAIARALVKKPVLLLLDEATSALDNASEKLVQKTIDALQHGGDEAVGNLTVVSIAHRLSTVRNADCIFVLKRGEVVERGAHAELVEKAGVYHALTKAQAAADDVAAATAPPPAATAVVEVAVVSVASESAASASAVALGEDDDAAAKGAAAEAADAAAARRDESDAAREKRRLKELADAKYEAPTSRILSFADGPTKALFPLAIFACLFDGASQPVQGWFMAEAVFDFFLPYQCPADCALSQYDQIREPVADDAAAIELAGGLNYTTTCVEAMMCDDFSPSGTKSPLKYEADRNALIFLVIAGLHFASIYLKMYVYRYIQEVMTRNMRGAYLERLLTQEIGFFDDPENTSAALTSALAKQTQLVSAITGIQLGSSIGSACALLIGVGMAFFACWTVALACLGFVPVLAISMTIMMQLMYSDADTGGSGAHAQAGAIANEAVLNIRTVRACRGEHDVLSRFSAKVGEITTEKLGGAWKAGLGFGIGNGVFFILYVIVFEAGPRCADAGPDDPAYCDPVDMFKALNCVMFGAMGAGMGAAFLAEAEKAKIASFDMFTLLDRKSKVDAMAPTGAKGVAIETIDFEDVAFTYPHRPDVPVLKGFTLSVKAGQTVALVGPSGSGKSTIVQLLQRFYDPAAGSIKVGGTELAALDVAWWRSQLGFVGQEPFLFNATLEENLRYGKADATRDELLAAAKLANLDFLLDSRVGWEDSVGVRGDKLSGGQKQRVAIARALARSPKVLLLDEATSALDSASERVVQEALDNARRGRTTFVIAHRLSTIQDADVIVVLVDGAITEQGTHAELVAQKGVYYSLQQKAAA